MKKVLFIFMLASLYIPIMASQTPDQAAKEKLDYYLQSIPVNQYSNYGFDDAEDLARAIIEPGYRILSLSDHKIRQWDNKQTDASIFKTDSLRLYPISVNNHYTCMLAVDYTNSEWKAVSIGFRDLAKQMDLIKASWKQKEIRIVRVFPLQRYYFTIDDFAYPNCTRINFSADKAADNIGYTRVSALQEALREMKQSLGSESQTGGNHEK